MTLTESCVVVAVIGTTMAIAAPSLIKARESYILRSSAHEVASQLHNTRIKAVTMNRDCRLRVTSATTYVIECEETSAWTRVESVSLPDGITITANARPEFHKRGNVSPTATIILADSRGRSRRVVVNVNGRVRIQ